MIKINLEDAGVTLIDCDHKTPTAQDNGFPYIGIPQLKNGHIVLDGARLISDDDFHHWRRKAKPTHNDVILSRRCNPGETAFVPPNLDIALGQNLVLLRSNGTTVYPPFLRWLVRGDKWWEQVNKFLNVGAVFDSLKCADIPRFEVLLPAYKTQIKIAEILNSIDNKITINRQINQTLEAMAQALFKSWFVDFEPVKARLSALAVGGSTDDANLAAMSAISGKTTEQLLTLKTTHPDQFQQLYTTADLFPSEMVDSELGEIPKGWEVKQIKDFGNVVCGKTPSKSNDSYYGNFMPFIKIPDMHHSVFVVEPIEFLSQQGAKSQIKKTLPSGSVCVSCIATVGKVIITHEECQTNQQINSVVPNLKEHTYYLYYSMLELEKKFYELASGGSATLNMNTSIFSSVKVLMPTLLVAKEFNQRVQSLMETILVNMKQNANLSELRDALLPKLLAGELLVDD